MRVTNNILFDTVDRANALSTERLVAASRVASDGVRVVKPSDDPAAFATIVDDDARLAVLASRSKTIGRVTAELQTAETTLASAGELLIHARELSLQASNGTLDASSRAVIGVEISQIRSALLSMANTRGSNGYIFGGTRTDTPPFDPTGAFVGNDNAMTLEIATGVTLRVNPSGARAFTPAGGRDVFADLDALATALGSNDLVGINTSLDTLDADHRQVLSTRVDVGLTCERLSSSTDVTDTAVEVLRTARAQLSEADIVGAYSNLAQAQSAYERGVQVSKTILSVSSVNRG
ncbi:MAG: flagellar hook-associated protein FlgL [Deltaproteobacteria bacterium]